MNGPMNATTFLKRLFSLCLLTLLAFPTSALAADEPPTPLEAAKDLNAPAYVFKLKGVVDKVQLLLLRRGLKEAEKLNASAFIIDMDTPGGDLGVTMDILELLRKTKLPTLTYVNPNAGSAGALISIGTKRIYMRSNSVIGAAAVVTSDGGDLNKTMKQKQDSFNTARMRAAATENGHNPDIAEAFMVTEKELKIGETVIDGNATLLSLNGGEAVRLYNGKKLLAEGLAENLEDVLKLEHITGGMNRLVPTGFESTALFITQISWLLLLGGIVGAYIEMKAPGFGIPGIISLVCFAFFFLGHYIAALSGWEATAIFVVGAMLVVIEIFVVPGTVIAGMLGALMVFGSIVWAMVDHWPSQPGTLRGNDFEMPMLNLILALGGAVVVGGILAKVLPHTFIYRKMVLVNEPASTVTTSKPSVSAGDTGVAKTTLRPAGKGSFGDHVVDVMSDGTFIDAGANIRVVNIEGMKVTVESVS